MRWQDTLKLVWRSIISNRMRSILTALGITIGIGAVSMLTAIGEGVKFYVLDNFSQFGTRIIAINPGKTLTQGMGGLISTARPLTLDDAESLRNLPHVKTVVTVVQGTGAIEYKERTRNSDIIGTSHEMPETWHFEIATGRFLPNDPSGKSRPFAVLGHKMKQELFGNQNPLGQLVRVGGSRFRVIGTLKPKGQMLGFDLDDVVYIPTDKALEMFNRESLMEVDVTYGPNATAEQIRTAVSEHLIQRHGHEDFTITTQDEMLSSLDDILTVLTLAIAALGTISLFVGAVGILTILTTTVRERTAEIGLLRALGSTQKQILILFLSEAVVLSVVGGIAGIAGTIFLVVAIKLSVPELPLHLNFFYMLLALGLSLFIGLMAGVSPALAASRLKPIDALRTE